MSKPILTYERAHQVLIYNPETGSLHWRVTRPGAPKGALVGTRSNGYTQVEIDYRLYKAHRVIWLMQTGKWPTHHIDHKNRMRADNRWKNLREATPKQNARNRRPSKRNSSGTFPTFDEAVVARVSAEKLHYGEFAARPDIDRQVSP